jgi:type IV pilus assembly protein PilB
MGYITEDQLMQALAYQKEHKGEKIGSILISLGFITELQMIGAFAERLDLQVVDISQVRVDVKAVELVPEQLAEKYLMLPVAVENEHLVLVVNDPLNLYGIEDIRQTVGMDVDLYVAEAAPLKNAINYYYTEISAKTAVNVANESNTEPSIEEMLVDISDGDETPIINLVNSLIEKAYMENASDIHIEPFEKMTSVRMRIDGAIVD